MTFFQKRARTKLFIPAFLVVSAALIHAQRPQGGPVGDLVVDFVALDASGQPVAGLQPADVSIKIAGKQRTITALELKRFGAGGPPAAAAAPVEAAPAAAVPPPFATNAGGGAAAPAASGGRTVMIIVDQDSVRAGSERAILTSLEPVLKTLTAADRVAFHTTPRDTAQAGFNSGLAGVQAALAKFSGQKSARSNTDENVCRSVDTLRQLRSLIEGLPPSTTPATMIFFGSGLSVPSKSSSCEVTNDHYRALSSSVATSRVNMFVVQGDDSVAGRDDGLENLASVTSAGSVLRVIGPALGRVTAETAAYYLATVKAESDDKPGQIQRLELKLNKEGLIARSRSDVAIGRTAGPAAGAAGAPAAKAGAASAADMLRTTGSSYTDLQLRATAILSRGPEGKLAILTLVEPVDPAVKLKELIGGVVIMSVTPNRIVPFKADEKQLAARPVALPMSADPGQVKIRVAAVDESGKGGAVDVDVSTELAAAGTLKLGNIMLLAPRGANFSPQLTFSDEAEIGVYFELYGDVSKGVGAKVEIAATPTGPALESTDKPGGQQTSEPDKFILNAKLPIAKLAPGDYVVRAIVQLPGEPAVTVMRTLRKVAK